MKKTVSLILILSLLLTFAGSVFAAPSAGLTWDGKAATLTEIAKNCGYAEYYGGSNVDANGNFIPLWYDCAKSLWEHGLFLGSNGSFDLDNPLTRVEGVIMTIRILGKEAEAKATIVGVTFTDVPDWATPYVAYAVQNGIANGYSAAQFGANDPMTAAQYMTLILRAMGYQDGMDFTWTESYDKALEIGLIGKCEHAQYSRSNLFVRDDAAGIAFNAVFHVPTSSKGLLKDTITMAGKPAGVVPSSTRSMVGGSTNEEYTSWEIIHGDNYFQIVSLPGGNFNATATYYLYFGDFRGTVDYEIKLSPTGIANLKSGTFDFTEAEEGAAYRKLVFGFQVSSPPAGTTWVSNTLTIKIGDYVYTDTFSVNGTLTEMKLI